MWPALVLAWGYSSYLTRVTRSNMLEVLRQDYVRTARSKGLGERVVILRHSLRNALIPSSPSAASSSPRCQRHRHPGDHLLPAGRRPGHRRCRHGAGLSRHPEPDHAPGLPDACPQPHRGRRLRIRGPAHQLLLEPGSEEPHAGGPKPRRRCKCLGAAVVAEVFHPHPDCEVRAPLPSRGFRGRRPHRPRPRRCLRARHRHPRSPVAARSQPPDAARHRVLAGLRHLRPRHV